MERVPSLIISILVTILIAGNYFFFQTYENERERVVISRVLDGDTVEIEDGRKIRLANINTPEKKFAYSDLAKNYLSEFVGKEVYLEKTGIDKYSRTLGRLYSGEDYLNEIIVREGMAHSFIVHEDELEIFEDAQNEAIKNKRGIWEQSEFYNCVNLEINKYEEYVDITELCDVNFNKWNIKDESTRTYVFKRDFSEKIRIYSSKGSENETALFWGRENVWNDDGDSVFIRDSNGLLVYYWSY